MKTPRRRRKVREFFGRPFTDEDMDVQILKIELIETFHGFMSARVTNMDTGECWFLHDVRDRPSTFC